MQPLQARLSHYVDAFRSMPTYSNDLASLAIARNADVQVASQLGIRARGAEASCLGGKLPRMAGIRLCHRVCKTAFRRRADNTGETTDYEQATERLFPRGRGFNRSSQLEGVETSWHNFLPGSPSDLSGNLSEIKPLRKHSLH